MLQKIVDSVSESKKKINIVLHLQPSMYLNLRKLNRLTFIDELSKNVRKYKTYFILMMDLKGFRHTQQKYLLIFSYYDILNKSVSFPIVIVL